MADFPFQSYCWALGTTSFRTADFNVKIERQLDLLDRFRDENTGDWRGLQSQYYNFLLSEGFVRGKPNNPAKDAREITSGLKKLGLIDGGRRLTSAGKTLLELSRGGDFAKDNPLQISNDSFVYLKQMLKTSDDRCGTPVRPYVLLAYAMTKFGELSEDEYTYLLPLCVNAGRMADIFDAIPQVRLGLVSIDGIIIGTLLTMDNYKAALDYLLSAETVTASVIMDIGMNRKSGSGGLQGYDLQLFNLYETLHRIVFERDSDSVLTLLDESAEISGNAKAIWRKYLFRTVNRKAVAREKLDAMNGIPLLKAESETEFRREFFRLIHLFKAKATLEDYADLNRRYFQTTDTVIFADRKVTLDTVPKCWLGEVADKLPQLAFEESALLSEDVSLAEIAGFLEIDTRKLYNDLELLFGVKIESGEDANAAVKRERYARFNKLVDEKFTRGAVIDLLKKFEKREDGAIRQYVTNNADVPTIFEYVLGIAWYHVSERRGDVLEHMRLSLEADLLPRSHAGGGGADIVWRYGRTDAYPEHSLLLEATLADSTNQRRMEMEPVSRHLGEHILSEGGGGFTANGHSANGSAYCVFISTYLHRNVISDFRNRRTYEYYSDKYANVVRGLKILPLATSELRTVLERGTGYNELYPVFENAYRSNEPIPTWYEREIVNRINTSSEITNKP